MFRVLGTIGGVLVAYLLFFKNHSPELWWLSAVLLFSQPLYLIVRFFGMWLEWVEEAVECDDLAELAKQGNFLLLSREHQDSIRSARRDIKNDLFSSASSDPEDAKPV